MPDDKKSPVGREGQTRRLIGDEDGLLQREVGCRDDLDAVRREICGIKHAAARVQRYVGDMAPNGNDGTERRGLRACDEACDQCSYQYGTTYGRMADAAPNDGSNATHVVIFRRKDSSRSEHH